MDNSIFGKMLEIETDFQQLQYFITILKDAVENNDNSMYLYGYVSFIDKQMVKYFAQLDEYNQKIGQIIISQ